MIAALTYLLASALIGYLGRDLKFGPTAWFFISLLFTPLIAGLMIMIVKENQSEEV